MSSTRLDQQKNWRSRHSEGGHAASPGEDLGRPLGDDLYVRSWRGSTGACFRGTQVCHEGWIRAGGVEKNVTFVEEVDPDINDQIDAAYHAKYRRHAARYVNSMVAPEARAATIKLVPRSTNP